MICECQKNVFEKEQTENSMERNHLRDSSSQPFKKQPRFLQIPNGPRWHVWGSTTYSLTLLLNTAVAL